MDHPHLNTSKTFSEFSNSLIKVPRVKCIYILVLSDYINTGNNVSDGGSVKGKKEGTQKRSLRDTRGVKRHLKSYYPV